MINIVPYQDADPMWPNVQMTKSDFRPHIEGDWINLVACLIPIVPESEMPSRFVQCAVQIASHYCEHIASDNPKDVCQIIVGWPMAVRTSGRQIVKTGGALDDVRRIANGTVVPQVRGRWNEGLTFPQPRNEDA